MPGVLIPVLCAPSLCVQAQDLFLDQLYPQESVSSGPYSSTGPCYRSQHPMKDVQVRLVVDAACMAAGGQCLELWDASPQSCSPSKASQ